MGGWVDGWVDITMDGYLLGRYINKIGRLMNGCYDRWVFVRWMDAWIGVKINGFCWIKFE